MGDGGEVDVPPPAAPQATIPASIPRSRTRITCGTKRLTRFADAKSAIPTSAAAANSVKNSFPVGYGGWREEIAELTVRGVVAIESDSVFAAVPGVTVAAGAKEAAAPVGSWDADTLSVTVFENAPPEGDTIRVKSAICPALMGGLEIETVTE